MVSKKESIACLKEPILTALCAQVTEKPETINTSVLKRGKSNVAIEFMPSGGKTEPVSIAGHKEE
jgi:hypothetical protein